jgi:hypothetical protein
MLYYPLEWVKKNPDEAYCTVFFPQNWRYYAPSRTFYPSSRTNNPPTCADLSAKTVSVQIDEKLFTHYFNSLGALQNAWIVVVSDILKTPTTFHMNKDSLETLTNVGRSITAIFALLINYRNSAHDKSHEKLERLHEMITNFTLSLHDVTVCEDVLKLLLMALTNFQANTNLWTPCISATQMLLSKNFVMSHAKMSALITKMVKTWNAMKAKTD